MKWEDVPTPVIEQVLDKWKSVLVHGEWIKNRTWTPCALCEFVENWMSEMYINAPKSDCPYHCPASNGDWCNEKGIASRLSMSYHTDLDGEKTEEWLANVEEFVKGLEKHLERRKRKEIE